MGKRLIASTMTQRVFKLEEAVDNLLAIGFDTIELCSVDDWVPHFDLKNATDKTVFETAAMLKAKGMAVHCINVGGVHTVEEIEKVYALAKETNAKIVTYACGCMEEGKDYDDLMKARAEFNARLADLGDKYGVICSIEAPHKLSLAENVKQIDAYWAMQDARVKCTFDTAHLTYSGEDMIAVAKRYVHRIVHSHLRDAEKGNSLLRYGEGVVDFKKYLDTLEEGGYKGKFSMEYPPDSPEEAAERLIKSREYLSQFSILK